MNKLETLQKQLEELQDDASAIETQIDNFEIDEDDYEDQYIEMIDSEGAVMVAGMAFTASRILQELDPIAYSCGLSDYVGCIDPEKVEGYKELVEDFESLETQIITLEEEIEELEEEEA